MSLTMMLKIVTAALKPQAKAKKLGLEPKAWL